MHPHDAYIAARRTLSENLTVDLLDEEYDPECFGNFVISFRHVDRNGSIVTDRGQMFICDKLRGDGNCKMLFNQLQTIGEQELTSILVALFESERW